MPLQTAYGSSVRGCGGLLDTRQLFPTFTFRWHKHAVSAICFHRNGALMVTGDLRGTLALWDTQTFKAIEASDSLHADSILNVASIKDNLLSQGRDHRLHEWTPTMVRVKSRRINAMCFCKMRVLESGGLHFIALPCRDDSGKVDVMIWEEESYLVSHLAPVQSGATHFGFVMALEIFWGRNGLNDGASGQGKFLLVGYESGRSQLRFLNGKDNPVLWTSPNIHVDCIFALSLHPSEPTFVSVSASNAIQVQSLVTGERVASLKTKCCGHSDVKFREDGKLVFAAGLDGRVRVLESRKWKPKATIDYHADCTSLDGVRGTVLAAHAKRLAIGAGDGKVSLWEIFT